jgi:hypothetical protein
MNQAGKSSANWLTTSPSPTAKFSDTFISGYDKPDSQGKKPTTVHCKCNLPMQAVVALCSRTKKLMQLSSRTKYNQENREEYIH